MFAEPLERRQLLAAVTSQYFDYAGTSQSVKFTFDANMIGTIHASDFTLQDDLRDQVVDSDFITMTPSVDGKTFTFDWQALPAEASVNGAMHPAKILADGFYTASISNPALTGSPATFVLDFAFYLGDATGDRRINFDDLLILAQNYGTTSGATYSQGDFNYDHAVAFDDLLTLAQRYNGQLIYPPTSPNQLTVSEARANSLTLRWAPPADEDGFTGFHIFRKRNGESDFHQIPDVTIPREAGKAFYTFIDSSLWDGTRYFYYVVPYNDNPDNGYPIGDWSHGAAKNAVTVLPAPSALSSSQIGDHGATLSWTDSSKHETSFNVYRSTNGGSFELYKTVPPRDNAGGPVVLEMNDLAPGTHYTFYVEAANSLAISARGVPASFETLSADVVPLSIEGPDSAIAGDHVVFSARGGNFPDEVAPVTYIWQALANGKPVANGEGAEFGFTANSIGSYYVRLTSIQNGKAAITTKVFVVARPLIWASSFAGPKT